uniref:glutamate synthase (ferredoxin) n=1 Tax=Eucampia antarctica TaxID=49252 RepID=A0A7S2WL87_9STRA|mmetsp:Transcript_4840/g.4562  ORF Transcript_4840/g.4562 Transcript_4840/m.4562 type:complete len:1710 (+) Transcript_4840:163-5292(+)|eukprot:CAMPEP_0197837210 /NCGR_PEP_ID=MMETSP1437-20131217/31449_1 /TAXON_ID=49252 ORGANISM="Eucampia antarctica, Strain CCMP1452" /NCGR_SAMPLE_ID=MMETSP1437 /ASSEMBLY_ACC=CAM_ASM_001096 /LENGTH=1709 /DNA_ID=CAMNT_0043444063 /DNA_START=159 /DNA_END=5288 /DNA_ORIENTATION=+
MRFSSGVIAAIAAPMAAIAFMQPLSHSSSSTTTTSKSGAFTMNNRDINSKALSRSEAVQLKMAFQLEDGQTSNIFDGPLALTKERDACGVGFIANTKAGGEFGTHKVLKEGLTALGCMEHRGACSADGVSGDGAGVMTQIPWKLFSEYRGENCPQPGVGMIFLPRDEDRRNAVKEAIESVCSANELDLIGWREVPVDPDSLGSMARDAQPSIWQFFVKAPSRIKDDDSRDGFERTLYLVRRRFDVEVRNRGLVWDDDDGEVYVCSLSSRTIVYKGMVQSGVLPLFYKDLVNPIYTTKFVIYHRRFSTNTNPRWPLAQPFRVVGHNGEINTLLGNVNWIRARETAKGLPITSDDDEDDDNAPNCDIRDLVDYESTDNIVQFCNTQDVPSVLEPLVDLGRSDSANLDSVMELMCRSRHRAPCAIMALVPTAYENSPDLKDNPEIVDFYKFHGGLLEAWDGPALLVFSDGKSIGASLDRNGLRPARYSMTKDGTVYMMSETGVIPSLDEADIVEKGRLGPGQMINVDLETGEFKGNIKIKSEIASRHPYGEWIENQRKDVEKTEHSTDRIYDAATVTYAQSTFGWGLEDISMQIADMAGSAKETTYSMGDDAPIAGLSERPHVVYNYFKQRFAQVTNPPIDPLREGVVMSLAMTLGKKESIYKVSEKGARLIHLESPVLNKPEMDIIKSYSEEENGGFKQTTLSTRYDIADGPTGVSASLEKLCNDAVEQVRSGSEVLILSDFAADQATLDSTTYVSPLLAVGAVHHRLIDEGLRMDVGIVVETGSAWSTHHYACLVGYGANAVHPYLALETVRQWHSSERTQKQMQAGKLKEADLNEAQENYRLAVEAGLLKILSKMGISLLTSYSGAQIFEAIGLGDDVIKTSFKGTTSRIGGMSLADLANEVTMMRPEAVDAKMKLINYGYYKPIPRSGEYHANSSDLAKLLHDAIGLDKKVSAAKGRDEAENDGVKPANAANYEIFKKSLEEAPLANIRDLLDFESDRESIPLTEVEPVEEIMKRFCTGAMSLGALSREAHETLAIAVNRVGGKSNSGEGGEDVIRGKPIEDVDEKGRSPSFPHLAGLKKGDSANSYIHQVASGRFGVTPEFLVTAKQLEIKMAQGAKPGEGGQLPGPKVSDYIAKLRASKPGVTLISPPPHHDIYSIEDLAQLVHDLHAINEKAGVSVKLVSSIGIGTVACGVAKAQADVIQISGGDGGTGASPLSSIKNAGCPWELGLTEAHSALLSNGLRGRVVLRVDGGIRTGRDVAIAALLGGEEFGFGTIAMIAEGCIMARVCHLNTCPVGVTSQKENLRKKFPGTPEHVVNFFHFAAEEVRQIMSHLGYSKFEDIIGRADLLTESKEQTDRVAKTRGFDLNPFFAGVPDSSKDRDFLQGTVDGKLVSKDSIVHINGPSTDLDRTISANEDIKKVIEDNAGVTTLNVDIYNTDRSTCAMLSGDIARAHGNCDFDGRINLNFSGSAGQSFGAFLVPGVNVRLEGESNDYVGKGMHGGEIIVVPDANAGFVASESSIIGNACLYGATGGDFHANGRAGERFCVRNSGAYAVAEGAGDHCCEYMTGGVVVILGSVGRNVGAGQTGGIGYFYDADNTFEAKVNREIVKMQRIPTPEGEAQLKYIVERHFEKTGSEKAESILNNWEDEVGNFWQIYPPAESKSPMVIKTETVVDDTLRVSASAPDGEMCFLPIGGQLSPEQTQRCAD